MLHVIRDPRAVRALAEDLRRDGRRIAFVPTMGYLHQGHVSLLEEGRRRADVLFLSIFVNPTQFGPSEDLAKYPRDEEGDLAKARGAGTDYAFCPDAAAMYPPGAQTFVQVRELQKGLCGDRRPGHFDGVATVVTKLFNIVRPHVALFGEKDYQQLAVIRRMVKDLDFDIEIVGMPIVREPDGLAMSSRNAYLSAEERQRSLGLSRGLRAAEALVAGGERDPQRLVAAATREILAAAPDATIDYVEVKDAESLTDIARLDKPAVLALAVFVGKTRLIDNTVLRPPTLAR
jgi:pantoate--beta-alanine ligase